MKLSYAPFRRELTQPFFYGDRSISHRSGICLRAEGPQGVIHGEASPLPGHSRESIEETLACIKKINSDYCTAIITNEDDAADFFPASLTFGLEGIRAIYEWNIAGGSPVRSNALVPWGGVEQTLEHIWARKAEGYSTIKLKVLEGKVSELLEVLSTLEGKGIQVRLDANRALSEGSLRTLFSGLEKFSPVLIDYLEEPFPHWRHPLLERSPVALAADECAADPRYWPAILAQKNGPSVFVLKPTVGGGLFSLQEKASQLRNAGKRVVYTSALEAEPGRRSIMAFLSLLNLQATAGISTGFLFRENFLSDRPMIESLPAPSEPELAWLDSLPWENLP